MSDAFSEERANEPSGSGKFNTIDEAISIQHCFEKGLDNLSDVQLIGLRLSVLLILVEVNNEWNKRDTLVPLELINDEQKVEEWLSKPIP